MARMLYMFVAGVQLHLLQDHQWGMHVMLGLWDVIGHFCYTPYVTYPLCQQHLMGIRWLLDCEVEGWWL